MKRILLIRNYPGYISIISKRPVEKILSSPRVLSPRPRFIIAWRTEEVLYRTLARQRLLSPFSRPDFEKGNITFRPSVVDAIYARLMRLHSQTYAHARVFSYKSMQLFPASRVSLWRGAEGGRRTKDRIRGRRNGTLRRRYIAPREQRMRSFRESGHRHRACILRAKGENYPSRVSGAR